MNLQHPDASPVEAKAFVEGLIACETALRVERSKLDQKISQLVALARAYDRLAHPPRVIDLREVKDHNAQREANNFLDGLTPSKLRLLRRLAREQGLIK
jgi:hypothetical protein